MANDTNGLIPADKEVWTTAFLALLPIAITAQGWTNRGKAITSGEARISLAGTWADYAVAEQRLRFGDEEDGAGPDKQAAE